MTNTLTVSSSSLLAEVLRIYLSPLLGTTWGALHLCTAFNDCVDGMAVCTPREQDRILRIVWLCRRIRTCHYSESIRTATDKTWYCTKAA